MSTTISDQFGRLLVASQLEDAVMDTLKYWFPTYLAEIARQTGISINDLPAPQNYTNRNRFDTELGEQVPKIVVLTPGTVGTPGRDGYGTYRVTWRLGVGVAASGRDEQMANFHVKAYAAAIRGIMEQQSDFGGLEGVIGVRMLSESYDSIPIPNQHQLFKGANCWFAVEVYDVVTDRLGPQAPITTAPPPWTEAEKVIIDVEELT